MKDFRLGIRTTFEAFSFVFNNKLGHYFLYPIAITLILLYGAKTTIDYIVEYSKTKVGGWIGIDQSTMLDDPEGFFGTIWFYLKKTWDYISNGGVEIILYIVFFYITHKVIKYVTLILMSPVMAFLSEKTEQILVGKEYPFDREQFLKDIWRGILLAIRNFFVEMSLVLLIWLATFIIGSIPLVNALMIVITPASVILIFLIGAYFYGFSTIDYVNERRKLNMSQSIQFVRKNKWLAIGNGALFIIFISIPVIGAYLGPIFATIMCTTGAVLAIHKKVGLDNDEEYILMTQKEIENKQKKLTSE